MCYRISEKSRDVMIILIIILIGALIRIPIGNLSEVDTNVLHDADSYLYKRLAIEFVEKPISEWTFFTYRSQDPIMNSVSIENDPFTSNLLPICAALICKLLKFLTVDDVTFYFNVILCPISALPTYVFMKKHFGSVAAITSSFAMAISPAYFFHTMAGYFDTDAIIMVLATTFMLSHIESFVADNQKEQLLFSAISLITLFCFYLSWEAYYVYAMLSVAISIVMLLLNRRENSKQKVTVPLLSSFIIVSFCTITIKKSAVGSLGRTITTMLKGTEWPDESKYIQELKTPLLLDGGLNSGFEITRAGVVNWFGALPMFILLFASFALLLVYFANKKLNKALECNKNCHIVLCLVFWSALVAISLPYGIRFVQLLVLPLNLIVGVGSNFAYNLLNDKRVNGFLKNIVTIVVSIVLFGTILNINVYLAILVSSVFLIVGILAIDFECSKTFVVVLVLAFMCPLISEYQVSIVSRPLVDDDFSEAMSYIRENTDKNSSILSWWNDGYYFECETRRHVLADGGIYDSSYFYWLSNAFSTDDENLTIGICGMLQSGNVEASYMLEDYLGDAKKATEVLKEILVLNKANAKRVLLDKYGFSNVFTNEILEYTHPDELKDTYILMYDDMVDVVAVIGYFGLWNFDEDVFYEVNYDSKEDRYIYPEELKNSVVVKYLEGKPFDSFVEVFANDSVKIYKVKMENAPC